jgi:hypothetical protein
MNLGSLNIAVLAALNRQRDTQAAAMLPVWRQMGESDIFSMLRAGWMVRRGGAIFSNPIEVLPPSIIEPLGVSLLRIDVPATDVAQLVDPQGNPIIFEGDAAVLPGSTITPDPYTFANLNPIGPEQWGIEHFTTGIPTGFAIEGFTIRLIPWPGKNSWVSLAYYSSGVPLVNDADFNETLSRAPAVYLYSMLKHAAIFYGDTDGQDRWSGQLETAIAKINASSYAWFGTGFQAQRG